MKNTKMLKSTVAMAALIVMTTGAAQACMPGMFGGPSQGNSCQPQATSQPSCQAQNETQGCAMSNPVMINPGMLDPAMIQAMANMASGGMQIASTVVQSLFGEMDR